MTILHSARHFHDLDYAPIEIDGAVIRSAPLNHPQEAVAYRIEADGAAFVLATDTEPGSSFHDDALRKLAQGADVLVYDAQYRPEQLKQEKKGWGHSSWLEGSRIAKECGINHLFLFHHDPDHADTVVDGLVHSARREFPNTDGAAEGTELQLPEVELDADFLASISERRRETRYRIELPLRLCWKAIGGEAREARSMTVDISRSGIQFIVPDQLPTGQPVELEVTVPDEISQCGDLTMRFRAEPLRQERVERSFARAAGRGMAARLISPQVKSSYAA
jgi:hypothetical protein